MSQIPFSRSCAVAVLLAILVGGVGQPCLAGTAAAALAGPATTGPQPNLPQSHAIGGRPSPISGRSVGILLAMGGAALITKNFEDGNSLAATLDGSPFDGMLDAGDAFGDGLTAGAGALGLYAAGRIAGNQRLIAAGGDLCESLALTWGSVWTLKLLIDADRPNGGDHSFPSGHTATAFATAPVLTEHFGWKVGVPAYALAAATALARVEDRRHYVADVLFGAAIGLVIGSEVTSKSGLRVVREHIKVSGRGLGLRVRF